MPRRIIALLLASLLAFAACGGDDSEETTADTEPAAAQEAEAPERIVSLSPTATEMLFAIDAGEQVVAVDDNSNFPEDAPTTDLSGFEPNVEAVIGYDPDLVVMSNDAEDAVAKGLKAAGIESLLLPAAATLEDTYAQIEQLGETTGHEEEAADLVAEIEAEVDDLTADVPEREEPLTYYYELDPTFFSVTSKTFIGNVFGLAGLENIADAADTDASGYPQLSAEYIIEQDPDLVFLADTKCCGQSPASVAARPGWDELTAVKNGGVHQLDDDVASRWGPRVVDLLRVAIKAVEEVPTP